MTSTRQSLRTLIGRRSLAVLAGATLVGAVGVVGYAATPWVAVVCLMVLALVVVGLLVLLRAELRATRREVRGMLRTQRQVAQRMAGLEQAVSARPAPDAAARQERLALEARSVAQFQRVIELLSPGAAAGATVSAGKRADAATAEEAGQ